MKIKKIVIALLCFIFILSIIKQDLWDLNEKMLKENILSIDQNAESINLVDITPFDWDVAYSFTPYTTKEVIYDTVGYKWDNIKETVSEGMNQIVFIKEGKVACYIYGYPTTNGYGISFHGENYKNGANILKLENKLNFQITRSNDTIYLNQIK